MSSWDDDDLVLQRPKLKWLQESQSAARSTHNNARGGRCDGLRQLLGLFMKCVHMRISLGFYFLQLVVIVPVLAIIGLAIIDGTTNIPPVVEIEADAFFSLGTQVSSNIKCAVFEPLRGSAIGGAWCSPMLFSPSGNGEVRSTMIEIAERNSWTITDISESDASSSTLPPDCPLTSCMLAFPDASRMRDWLKSNPGRAATAVVFVEDGDAGLGVLADQSGGVLPNAVAFEVWYNASALDLYAADGADLLRGFNGTSALVAAAQHAVEEVLLKRKFGTSSIKVHFRRYPRLRTARYTDVQRYYGMLAINVPVSLHAAGLLVQVVSEKELGLISVLRSLGMQESAYWGSFYLQHAVEASIVACFMYSTGVIVRLPMFVNTDLWVWFLTIWLLEMAACSTACLASVFIRRRSSASLLGTMGVILAGLIALAPQFADLRFEEYLTLFQDPFISVLDAGVLEFLYPPFALLKIVFDVSELTQRTPQLDSATGLTTYQSSGSYLTADLSRGNYTGDFVSTSPRAAGLTVAQKTYTLKPTYDSHGWLLARVFVTFCITWWLGQVLTLGNGRGRHPFFLLFPSFWFAPRKLRGNAPLLASLRMRGEQFTHLDVDVAAEAYAVLGGNLPDEKPVVFYDVAKSFGSTKAVRGVSVSLQQDELFALLGRNGAGKTTIVNMLTAKSAVSRGDMLLYGASVANDVDKVRSMIGVCTQEDVLHASLSASQHLWLFGRFYGVRGKDLREKVKEALDDVNLTQVRHKRAGHFSGGMKRRLSLACAYVGEPSVVALDEPTSGMDPYNRKKVWDVITSKKLSGRTTLLTTNSMEEAEVLAHTVGILAEGQLIALGSAPHLKRRFGAGYTIKLVTVRSRRGDDHMQLLQAEVRARLPEVELVDVTASSCTYSIAEDKMARANKLLRYIEQLKKESDDYFDQFRRPTFDAPPQSKSAWLLQQLGFSAKRLNPPAAHSQASDGLASDSPSGERGGQPAHAHAHAPPPKILLKDWLVTHTSLEEVFVRLAHQQNERSNKADADAPPIGAAEAEIAEEEEEIEDAAETGAPAAFEEFEDSDAGSQAGSESVYARQRARQLRAAALKNIALYRRQWRRHTTNALMSAGLILALYLSQLLLIDRPSAIFETEAARLVVELTASCTSVSDAFDKACADGTSLEGVDACSICAQPLYTQFEACCIDLNYSLANHCLSDQCVGIGVNEDDPDTGVPDFSADCVTATVDGVEYPRPYCTCTKDGERSVALQERINQTPICRAYRQQVSLEPTSMPIFWLPTNSRPGALDQALYAKGVIDDRHMAWLGWKVPMFGGDAGSLVAKYDVASHTLLGEIDQPVFGSGQVPTFPATSGEQATRAASRNMTDAQVSAADTIAAGISVPTGVLSHFPRALGRTSFQTASNQPSADCTVARAAVKCCYKVNLTKFGPYDLNKEVDVCSGLGGDCPTSGLSTNDFLRNVLGWTAAEVSADANVNVSSWSSSKLLGVGSVSDFAGRPTECSTDTDGTSVTPLCAAIRTAAGTNLTCATIREARDQYLGFVNASSPAWSQDNWDADASWECVDASCVQYEQFVVPAYTSATDGDWKSQADLNEQVLKDQLRILGNYYADANAVDSYPGVTTNLNVGEWLFPSWSVDIFTLNVPNATAEITITSFFRSVATGFFYVTEPLGQTTGLTESAVRANALARPHALEGQLELSRQVPAMLQNAFVNGILKERLDDSHSIRVGARPMPELSKGRVAYERSLVVDSMSIAALPFACVLALPQITYGLVQDKEYKVRSLMSMMGMPQLSYWLIEWAFASINVHVLLMLIWVAGTYIMQLTSFTRSKGALVIVLQVWAQLLVALAILASTFFTRSSWAALVTTMLLVASLVTGATIYTLSLQEIDNAPIWFATYDIWPPFAFFHCVWLLIRVQVSVEDLSDAGTEVGMAFQFLLIHIAWVYPFAMYLDATLPREFGIPESPLFCLRRQYYLRLMLKLAGGVPKRLPGSRLVRACMPRLAAALKVVERGAVDARMGLSRESVEDGIEKDGKKEDVDVRHEREAVERGSYASRALIQIFSLHKVWKRDRVALHNLTLKVEADECFGLLGPNGAGKTTTISVLTGLYPPTKGNALVAGHDILRQMPQIYKSIGVCPQFDILWPDLTVSEHLHFYARVKGCLRKFEKTAVHDAAQGVGLRLVLNKRVHQLSAGQKRRVSLAIALLGSPAVIFLDEPTTGLDPESRRVIWQVIENSKPGRAMVLTTHAMEEADALCTRIGILANGALRALGTNVHLKNKFGDGYKVDISFMPSKEPQLHAFVRHVLPTAELDVSRTWTGNRTYKVRREDVSLARLFHRMDNRPESAGIIHWGVRQTSLEEVFLIITSDYELQVDGSQGIVVTPRAAAIAAARRVRGKLSSLGSSIRLTGRRQVVAHSVAGSLPSGIAQPRLRGAFRHSAEGIALPRLLDLQQSYRHASLFASSTRSLSIDSEPSASPSLGRTARAAPGSPAHSFRSWSLASPRETVASPFRIREPHERV